MHLKVVPGLEHFDDTFDVIGHVNLHAVWCHILTTHCCSNATERVKADYFCIYSNLIYCDSCLLFLLLQISYWNRKKKLKLVEWLFCFTFFLLVLARFSHSVLKVSLNVIYFLSTAIDLGYSSCRLYRFFSNFESLRIP